MYKIILDVVTKQGDKFTVDTHILCEENEVNADNNATARYFVNRYLQNIADWTIRLIDTRFKSNK